MAVVTLRVDLRPYISLVCSSCVQFIAGFDIIVVFFVFQAMLLFFEELFLVILLSLGSELNVDEVSDVNHLKNENKTVAVYHVQGRNCIELVQIRASVVFEKNHPDIENKGWEGDTVEPVNDHIRDLVSSEFFLFGGPVDKVLFHTLSQLHPEQKPDNPRREGV